MLKLKRTIALEGVRFFAYHGYYPEEQKIGNEYLVDIKTESLEETLVTDELEDTVNYERLFEIAQTEMKTPKRLIESVAHGILTSVVSEFPKLDSVVVTIRKLHLPVRGEIKNSLVELSYMRSELR